MRIWAKAAERMAAMRRSLPKNRECTRWFSAAQEERVANLIGGMRSPNSGAGNFAKGDVCTRHMLVECKTPMSPKGSVSVKREWIDKNAAEAFGRRIPNHALAICFEPGGENWFVIGEGLFKWLCEKLDEEDC